MTHLVKPSLRTSISHIKAVLWVSNPSFLIQLLVNLSGKAAQDGSNTWIPTNPTKDLAFVSWLPLRVEAANGRHSLPLYLLNK